MAGACNIYFDGGAKPNPGKLEYCVVIMDGNIDIDVQHLDEIGTNNEAEWLGLYCALVKAEKWKFQKIKIHGDSRNIIMQISGAWKMKESSKFYEVWKECNELVKKFENIEFVHVPREKNIAGMALEKFLRGGTITNDGLDAFTSEL